MGNAGSTADQPWGYAGYPAALPHVLGVSRCAGRHGAPFSNRDLLYNDIAAPGEDIFSTLPRALTSSTRPGCVLQGYSDCGPIEFRRGEGTSFSAPQVPAAAAVLLGSRPQLRADQVAALLTRSAVDAESDTGCQRCSSGRDALTGWGVLNVQRTRSRRSTDPYLSRTVSRPTTRRPPQSGCGAARVGESALRSTTGTIRSTSTDQARRGQRLVALLRGPGGTDTNLFLWKPGTRRVAGFAVDRRRLAAQSKSPARSSESAFASGRVAGTSSR